MGPGTFNLKAWSLGRLEGRRAEEMPIAFLPNDYPLMLRIPKGTWRVSIFQFKIMAFLHLPWLDRKVPVDFLAVDPRTLLLEAQTLPPGLEPGLQDSKSWVLTTALWEPE